MTEFSGFPMNKAVPPTRNRRDEHFRGAQGCHPLTACGSQPSYIDNTWLSWITRLQEVDKWSSTIHNTRWKCTETAKYKRFRTVLIVLIVPEAIIVGTGFGKWCWKKGCNQISKISFNCCEKEFEVSPVRNLKFYNIYPFSAWVNTCPCKVLWVSLRKNFTNN